MPTTSHVSINNIIGFLRIKFMERLMFMCISKEPHKLSALRRRHKIAQELLDQNDVIEEISHHQWLVPSKKKKNLRIVRAPHQIPSWTSNTDPLRCCCGALQ